MLSRRSRGCAMFLLFVSSLALPQAAAKKQTPDPVAEKKASAYFESVRNQPLLLERYLRQMPKVRD